MSSRRPASSSAAQPLLLLDRVCLVSGCTVRHIVRLPVDLASEDLAKEVAEYRAVGWRVAILWKGASTLLR